MFSGHGAELNGEHYLLAQEMVPIDKPERVKTRAVHQQEVLKKLEAKNPIVTLGILDCCREKVSFRARRAFGGPGGLAALPGPAGSLVMYATGAGQLAQDGEGVNGVFTKVLLKYLDKPLKLEDIAKKVAKEVSEKTGRMSSSARMVYSKRKPSASCSSKAPIYRPILLSRVVEFGKKI